MPSCTCGRQFNGLANKCPRCAALHTLELQDGATAEDIRASYRTLAKVWHPDRFEKDAPLRKKADEKLKEINGALQLLKSAGYGKQPTPASPPPHHSQATEPAADPSRASSTQENGSTKKDASQSQSSQRPPKATDAVPKKPRGTGKRHPGSAKKASQPSRPSQFRQVGQKRIPEILLVFGRFFCIAIILGVIGFAKHPRQYINMLSISPPNTQAPVVANKEFLAQFERRMREQSKLPTRQQPTRQPRQIVPANEPPLHARLKPAPTHTAPADSDLIQVDCGGKASVPIYDSPLFKSLVITRVSCDDRLQVLSREDPVFMKIRTDAGVEGYIAAKSAK